MPKLTVLTGVQKGKSFPVPREQITIGRDHSNEIQLHGQKLSRSHAMLEYDGTGWLLTDLGSRNGTIVNNQSIKSSRLKSGDEIRIGEISMVFTTETEAIDLRKDKGSPQRILEETLILEGPEIFAKEQPEAALSDIKNANERLRALLDLTCKVGAARGLEELMECTAAAIDACIEPDRFVPIAVNQKGGLRPWALSRSDFDRDFEKHPISQSIVGTAREKLVGILSVNAAEDERFQGARSIAVNRIATAMCVPILHEQKLKMLLYVDRLGEAESFTRDELEMLNGICACLAPPLENIAFADRLNEERQVLVNEIRCQHSIIGQSEAIEQVYTFIEKAASSGACVLITGESGTGKELVARGIHYNSSREGKALEIVNCAALNHTLMDSELFGHARGAFTDAREEKPGRFELAHQGTIFLDEIGELSEESQSKLLRVLETGELRRLGDTADRHVDLRVIAATNRDLRIEMKEGKFRSDLFYRLNVLSMKLPPLRERVGDIQIIANHFLKEFGNKCARPELRFSDEAMNALTAHDWPGNVRELKNVVERMVVMCNDQVFQLEDVPLEVRGVRAVKGPVDLAVDPLCTLAELERVHIIRILQHTGGNKKETAQMLGIDRSTLYARIKTYGIET
ncbi:MAG: sigma 54-interacting transcriptional regulator [Planctomycetota bacterium]|nr:sigma 54-interacting transcriptional regulator [Planctomycetota bacterium]